MTPINDNDAEAGWEPHEPLHRWRRTLAASGTGSGSEKAAGCFSPTASWLKSCCGARRSRAPGRAARLHYNLWEVLDFYRVIVLNSNSDHHIDIVLMNYVEVKLDAAPVLRAVSIMRRDIRNIDNCIAEKVPPSLVGSTLFSAAAVFFGNFGS
jgi:hypothetical protein